MSDVIDDANSRAELELERAIAAARSKIVAPASAFTECLNCGDPPREGSRYCCKECAEDHEHRQRRLRNQGLR